MSTFIFRFSVSCVNLVKPQDQITYYIFIKKSTKIFKILSKKFVDKILFLYIIDLSDIKIFDKNESKIF